MAEGTMILETAATGVQVRMPLKIDRIAENLARVEKAGLSATRSNQEVLRCVLLPLTKEMKR